MEGKNTGACLVKAGPEELPPGSPRISADALLADFIVLRRVFTSSS